MKFFLVKDINPFPIRWRGVDKLHTGVTSIYHRSVTRKMNIISTNNEPLEMERCALLKKVLEARNASSPNEFWSCRVDVGVSALVQGQGPSSQVRFGSLEIIKFNETENDCLSQLAESFKEATLEVDWKMIVNDTTICRMSNTEMDLRELLVHHDGNVSCPDEHFENWKTPSNTILTEMTITVTLPDPMFNTRCESMPELSDLTIVCDDGTKIKANRCFLVAHSLVFLRMFTTDMKEARESILEISDIGAKSVNAFIELLYFGDTEDAEEDVQVAFDLFQAGHKYEIGFVEEQMRGLILRKPNNWFDLEVVVDIFVFARNLTPTDEGLKRKMAKVLELFSDTLEESPAMQELFQNNHKAALELLKYSSMRDSNTR